MRLVRGLNEAEARAIEDAVKRHGRFDSIEALWRASGVTVATLRRLARADAFRSMGLDRQAALWHVRALRDERLALFDRESGPAAEWRSGQVKEAVGGAPTSDHSATPPLRHSATSPTSLPHIPLPRQVVHDYAATGLSLKAHPVSFMRHALDARGVTPNAALRDAAAWPAGRRIAVAGIVLVRQRPATASGVVFMTIEDETGVANLILRPRVYARFRKAARHAVVILARGRVERQDGVVHVLAYSVHDVRDDDAGAVPPMSRDFH